MISILILQNYCSKLTGDELRLLNRMKVLEAFISINCFILSFYCICLIQIMAFALFLYAFLGFVALFHKISIKVWFVFLAIVRGFLTLIFYSLFQTIEILFSKRILLNMEVRYLHLSNLNFPLVICMLVSKSFFFLIGYQNFCLIYIVITIIFSDLTGASCHILVGTRASLV